jgi:TRAP-type mannitol/chloroaromatic compound transport system permease small subunit
MPNLTFVLPHWLYWIGLLGFPILAMVIVRKRMADTGPRLVVTMAIGYMLWLGGGFVGLHRYYVKSALGLIYIPLFLLILYGNSEGRLQRVVLSEAANNVLSIERLVKRYEKRLTRRKSARTQRSLDKINKELVVLRPIRAAAQKQFDFWENFSAAFAALIALLLAFDAFRLPALIRRTNAAEGEAPPPAPVYSADDEVAGRRDGPAFNLNTKGTAVIDTINGWTGEFVAFWSIIAVFVYYYEVIARYVFNSPTNWAHEAMFLMFGMQYLIAGAYALREDAHVRVDVIYLLLPDRVKVVTDLVTSVFFFVFAVTLMVTGFIFMSDAIDVFEVSFTEWAIQYWPVKITIVLGALLLLFQGISKLIKDIALLKIRFA